MNGSFNNTNVTSNHLKSNHVDEQGTAVVLSVVMPIVLVLFCVAYTIWSMERDTRPEKKRQSEKKSVASPDNTLRIQPIVLNEKSDVGTKETPDVEQAQILEVKAP